MPIPKFIDANAMEEETGRSYRVLINVSQITQILGGKTENGSFAYDDDSVLTLLMSDGSSVHLKAGEFQQLHAYIRLAGILITK